METAFASVSSAVVLTGDDLLVSYVPGPILPYSRIFGSTLITSPTNRGVILIGGYTGTTGLGQITNYLYELSGDSEENLTWSMLEQKLDVERHLHLSLPIPNQLIPSQFAKQE